MAWIGLLTIAGCGSGTAEQSTRSVGESSSAGASGPRGASTQGEASKPPARILADAAAALRAAHGYQMQGTILQSGQTLRLKLRTTSPTSLDLAFAAGEATAEVIELPAASFIQGNRRFWSSQGGAAAARLADRWIAVPASHAHAFTGSLGALAPATLSRCLLEDHGTLSLAGKTTIGGHPALLVRDAGNAPGSTPSLLAVAGSGVPYPLRYTATGGQRAGGRIDVCNDGRATDAHGSLSFGEFGRIAPIQPPSSAQPSRPGGPTA